MIGKLLLFITVAALAACAEPKYSVPTEAPAPGQKTAALRATWPQSQKQIWLEWETKPGNEEFGSFLLKIGRANLADQSALPEDIDGEVAVVLWMPSMGHGSSPVTVTKADVGTYRASRVFFSMPGDWEIRVQHISNGAVVEQTVFALRL